MNENFFSQFRNLDDQSWLNLHLAGSPDLPSLPSDEIQLHFTGRAGEENLRQAFSAYSFFKSLALAHVGPVDSLNILDFGCGWGRLLRFWLKDLPAEQVWGGDPWAEALEHCKKSELPVNLVQTPATPPSGLPASHFDVIYAFSVFSHLSRIAADQWVGEFAKLLRPSGLVIMTTRNRGHFDQVLDWKQSGDVPQWGEALYEEIAPVVETLVKSCDREEFTHQPHQGKHPTYGESHVPEQYVRTHWQDHFKLISYLPPFDLVDQNVIVLQRR